MHPDKILFIDVETGGLDPTESSLLSVGLAAWSQGEILAKKEILINDGNLRIAKSAIDVNGISIAAHKISAVSSSTAVFELDAFVSTYFDLNEKITLAGHNVNFDISFLKHFLTVNGYDFSRRFSHRSIDTSSILYYLYLSRRMLVKATSSQEAFDFFNIQVANRHSALGDVIATVELFNKLITLLTIDC